MRAGLANMLTTIPIFEVVGEADDCDSAISLYHRLQPDVVLLDIYMPNTSGLDCLKRLRNAWPESRILMLSSAEIEMEIQACFSLGARGFVSKSANPQELIESIQRVFDGELVLNKQITARLEQSQPIRLTARELEVLQLLRKGFSNPDIGLHLGITTRTAKAHVAALLAKMDAADRTEAVAIAFERGIIKP
jgi:DNA-binding NarL/FixJ family response regulator